MFCSLLFALCYLISRIRAESKVQRVAAARFHRIFRDHQPQRVFQPIRPLHAIHGFYTYDDCIIFCDRVSSIISAEIAKTDRIFRYAGIKAARGDFHIRKFYGASQIVIPHIAHDQVEYARFRECGEYFFGAEGVYGSAARARLPFIAHYLDIRDYFVPQFYIFFYKIFLVLFDVGIVQRIRFYRDIH